MTKKAKFLKKFNEAFAKSDTEYIVDHVTDDISWTIVGDSTVEGKDAFIQALKTMESEEPFELEIKNIITHGDSAAVNGTMKSQDGSSYAFCDIYKFSRYKNPKISAITSYVIELKK